MLLAIERLEGEIATDFSVTDVTARSAEELMGPRLALMKAFPFWRVVTRPAGLTAAIVGSEDVQRTWGVSTKTVPSE